MTSAVNKGTEIDEGVAPRQESFSVACCWMPPHAPALNFHHERFFTISAFNVLAASCHIGKSENAMPRGQ